MVFGDFDADGLTGLAIIVLALRRARRRRRCRTCRAGSTRATACRSRRSTAAQAAGATRHRHRRLRGDEPPEIAEAGRRGHRRPRHRPPPRPAGHCRPRSRSSTRIGPTARYPDRRLAGSGVAFKIAQLLLADVPGGPAAALDARGPRDHRDRRGRRADRRREPGDRPARAGAILRAAPRPGIAALLGAAERRAGRRRPRDASSFAIAPRLNAAGRVGEAVEAARLLLPTTTAEDASRHADALEAANQDAPRPAEGRASPRRGPSVDGDRDAGRRRCVHGPWPVGIVGLVASRLVEDLGPAGGRRRRPGRRRSGRRAGATGRWTSARPSRRAATSSPATAATPAPPASSCRRSAGRRSSSGSWRSRRPPRRPTRASPLRDRPGAARRSRSTTRCCASSRGWRRTAPATRSRSWPSSG